MPLPVGEVTKLINLYRARPDLFSDDQIEALDQQAESLKINYIAYPEKPNQSSDKIELSDVFTDAIIAKAIEYAGRRETGRAEPYEIAVRKAINAHRPLSSSSALSQQPCRSNRPVAYFKLT